jgi:hypothetical protein
MRQTIILAALLGSAVFGLSACFYRSSATGQTASAPTTCDAPGSNCRATAEKRLVAHFQKIESTRSSFRRCAHVSATGHLNPQRDALKAARRMKILADLELTEALYPVRSSPEWPLPPSMIGTACRLSVTR